MSLIGSIKGLGQDIMLAAKDPNNIKNPHRLATASKVAKIASVALAVAAVAVALFTGPIGFIFAAPAAIALYDTYKMADNIQSIAEQKEAGKTIPNPMSVNDGVNSISRGTILAKPILGLIAKKVVA